MNPKQKRVVKLIVEGKSQTAAYKEVYKTSNNDSARASASQMLSKPSVKNALQEALKRKGVDEDSIADTLLEMKRNRDWRAKESYVDRAGKFLGYDNGPQQLTQINVGGDMGVTFAKDDNT